MKTLHKLIIALLITFTASAEMPSYQWVDVRFYDGEVNHGTVRLAYTASNPANTTHYYELNGADLWNAGFGITKTQVIAEEAGNATYNFQSSVILGDHINAQLDNQPVPDPTPGAVTDFIEFPTVGLQIMQWGPVRVDQNGDGVHEPRQWIDVRISWTGGGIGDPGSWTGRLLPVNGSPRTYTLLAPNMFREIDGVWRGGAPSLTFNGDDSIQATPAMLGNFGTSVGGWIRPPGNGDYTGPLDRENGNPNDHTVWEYVILAQGPTVGGGGDDPIQGDPDGGGDGDGEDDDLPPDPEDDPPLLGEGPTGLDCIDSKLAKAEEEYNVEFLTTIAEGAQKVYIKSWYFNTAQYLPGGSIEVIIRSDGQYEQLAGAAEGINLAKSFSRIFSAIWFTLLAFNAFVAVTLSW